MSARCRPLLHELSAVTPVTWIAGSRHVPKWIHSIRAQSYGRKPTARGHTNQYAMVLTSEQTRERLRVLGSVSPLLVMDPGDVEDDVGRRRGWR